MDVETIGFRDFRYPPVIMAISIVNPTVGGIVRRGYRWQKDDVNEIKFAESAGSCKLFLG